MLALSACGSSATKSATTTESGQTRSAAEANRPPTSSTEKPRLATILVESGGRSANGRVVKQYTCRGANTSPPMTWGGVPSNAQEVVVLARTLTRGNLETNWVMGGISPKTTHLSAGEVPPGAVVGKNSLGEVRYSLCPPSGKPAIVVFAVLGLPHKLGLKTGFPARSVSLLIGRPGIAWGSSTAYTGNSSQVLG